MLRRLVSLTSLKLEELRFELLLILITFREIRHIIFICFGAILKILTISKHSGYIGNGMGNGILPKGAKFMPAPNSL